MTDMKVRYQGLSDERIIEDKDLQARSIKGTGEDLVWNANNGWTLVLPYSPELEQLLLGEGHFAIEQEAAPNPDAESDEVVDARTGQRSKTKK
jgi:hypothetical protein